MILSEIFMNFCRHADVINQLNLPARFNFCSPKVHRAGARCCIYSDKLFVYKIHYAAAVIQRTWHDKEDSCPLERTLWNASGSFVTLSIWLSSASCFVINLINWFGCSDGLVPGWLYANWHRYLRIHTYFFFFFFFETFKIPVLLHWTKSCRNVPAVSLSCERQNTHFVAFFPLFCRIQA